MAKLRAILFDLDGTLLDTEALSDKAMYAALDIIQHDDEDEQRLPWELKQRILGLRGAEWGPIVLHYAKTKWKLENLPTANQLWKDWEENINTYCSQVQACPGATQLVQELAEYKLPMAIATSSRQTSVNKKRMNHDAIFRHMNAIVCGDHENVQRGKPAPDIYMEAARQLNVNPQHCLVFEDALSGVRSAKAAGCTVVAVPDPRFDAVHKAAFAEEADLVLPDLWHFDGSPFGINVSMESLFKNA